MGRTPLTEPNPSIVGVNCRRLRLARGWSQNRTAQKAALSPSTVTKLELGSYQTVEMSTIQALATAFGVPPAELFATPSPNGHFGVPQFLQDFYQSPWALAMMPTRTERAWLEAVPSNVWGEAHPTPDAVASLLRWHRRIA